jgi:hypothetical protein
MKIQIRKGVFETNSSSVHALCLCTNDEYDKWKNGEYIYDRYTEELKPITPEIQEIIDIEDKHRYKQDRRFLTYEQFHDCIYVNFNLFEESKNLNGEEVIAFGYHGYDG